MKYKDHKKYRLTGYDYSQDGNYFVTICTNQKEKYFGDIVSVGTSLKMELSVIGSIAQSLWIKIPTTFQNVILDEFIIMPDHVHGIIIIQENVTEHNEHQPTINNLHPLVKKSISSIINHYKGSVKKWCNLNGCPNFKWQARFYDRIIRDEKEFYFIQEYIRKNVENFER